MEDEDERYRLIRCSWKHILEERDTLMSFDSYRRRDP